MAKKSQRTRNRGAVGFHLTGGFTVEIMAEPVWQITRLVEAQEMPMASTESTGSQDGNGVDEEPDEIWS